MQVIYCKKCHERKRGANFNDVLNKIAKLKNVTQVSDECISYCGPGRTEYFSLVDDELISGESLEDLLKNIEEFE